MLLRLRLQRAAFSVNAAAGVVQDDERLAERLFQKPVGRETRRNSTELRGAWRGPQHYLYRVAEDPGFRCRPTAPN